MSLYLKKCFQVLQIQVNISNNIYTRNFFFLLIRPLGIMLNRYYSSRNIME